MIVVRVRVIGLCSWSLLLFLLLVSFVSCVFVIAIVLVRVTCSWYGSCSCS